MTFCMVYLYQLQKVTFFYASTAPLFHSLLTATPLYLLSTQNTIHLNHPAQLRKQLQVALRNLHVCVVFFSCGTCDLYLDNRAVRDCLASDRLHKRHKLGVICVKFVPCALKFHHTSKIKHCLFLHIAIFCSAAKSPRILRRQRFAVQKKYRQPTVLFIMPNM